MEPLIELAGVVMKSEDYVILDGVSVGFPAGQSSVIMGPSGCGKSTLLKIAAGITVPDSGEVLVKGKALSRFTRRELMELRAASCFMFQDAALWANKTIYENLALPVQVHQPGLPQEQLRERVRLLLARLGLAGCEQLRPSRMSMGEAKAVSFLRAVILEPSLLFLDEPTTSLDHELLEKMMEMIRELRDRGCTIIAVTHDAHLASMIASHLVVLKEGRVLEAGPIEAVRRSRSREVMAVLSQVLSEAATYDADLLDLLGG